MLSLNTELPGKSVYLCLIHNLDVSATIFKNSCFSSVLFLFFWDSSGINVGQLLLSQRFLRLLIFFFFSLFSLVFRLVLLPLCLNFTDSICHLCTTESVQLTPICYCIFFSSFLYSSPPSLPSFLPLSLHHFSLFFFLRFVHCFKRTYSCLLYAFFNSC